MSSNKYFFINKDAASDHLAHSSGLQRSAIQKHVQSGLPRPRKSKTKKMHQVAETIDDKALYNPSIRQLSCKLDAFNTASTSVDRTTRSLLDYYIYYYHPTTWTYEPLAQSPQPYAFRNSVTQVVQTALQDPLSMYCLLSASASRIRNIDALPCAGVVEKEHFFMQNALSLMRERVTGNDVQSFELIEHLVSSIMFMGSAEAYRSNYTAARIHLEAALQVLEPWGGVTMLRDKNTQGNLFMSDLFLSSVNLEPCIFECVYDPGPASSLSLTDIEFEPVNDATLGMRLLAKDTSILPLPLKQLVCEILESFGVKCGLVVSSMSAVRAFETTHWVAKRNMAIRNRLFAFETFDAKIHALRTVLVMWTLLAMNITGRVKTVKVMATKLRSIVKNIPTREWRGEQDVRLWILIIGYSCAQEGSETAVWFAEHVQRMRTEPGEVTRMQAEGDELVQALIGFQRGFLFHAPVQVPRTEKLSKILSFRIDTS